MRKRFLVIGLGRFGSTVLKELYTLGHDVVGCDKKASALEGVQEYANYTVEGDATEDLILDEINVNDFHAVIVSTAASFESSIIIIAKLKRRNCRQIIVKSNERFKGEILSQFVGADCVIYPEEEAGVRTAKQLAMPGLKEYVELSPNCNGIEIEVPPAFINKTLRALDLRNKFNVTVLLINRKNHPSPIISPSAVETFQADDSIFVVGETEDLHKFQIHYFTITENG